MSLSVVDRNTQHQQHKGSGGKLPITTTELFRQDMSLLPQTLAEAEEKLTV